MFIIITEVIMANWGTFIGLHYTAPSFQSQDMCSRGGEMMVIFIPLSEIIMLNLQMVIRRCQVMSLLKNGHKHM